MKKLYLIGGPMGVGKTTVCQALKRRLPNSVFLDGDWCWDSSPFQVTEETKAMVMDNICHTLNNFLACSAYENVIFCWVMDRKNILDQLTSQLHLDGVESHAFSLLCTPDELTRRLEADIAKGLRQPDVVARSLERLPLYDALNTQKVDTTGQTVAEVVQNIVGTYN